ncbi:MAG TPA: hypothetical protein VL463_31860 [Kofleriaceae bacterium]|nr:hypothetical protein [Kofleriaceae bacterium]
MGFDPPLPPKEPATTIVARTAGLSVLAILVAFLRPLAIFLVPFALFTKPRRRRGEPPPLIVPDLTDTRAPQQVAGGVACTGCDAVVPFESMSIDERGYFCAGCARTM